MSAAGAALCFKPLFQRRPSPSPHGHPSSSFGIFISRSHSTHLFPLVAFRPGKLSLSYAIAEKEEKTILANTEAVGEGEKAVEGELGALDETKRRARPCELYICNLPRSYGISQLLEIFMNYGAVLSVEVSRDPETGISRGSGFVTMGSILEARSAIAALDGSDIDGREMRVKFSVDMVSGRKNTGALNSAPKRNIVFESPYKMYVGNLSWSVRPEDLREHFSQYGTVVSTRVLHDRKGGKNRVYAFLSFSTPDEAKAAIEATGQVQYLLSAQHSLLNDAFLALSS
ncbi:33 kDa ribonucleoprotein, chloroplastic [Apostasia shenzhenica]|uniref:33 kDa ribonucleoprotein, chloroplastic n=1 Tax=Apostasia shenzhenica TaxID=1088818 RepID=A0A2I0B0X8_9ASPA|nr:33 kDa ribonucleoprotein, chloroplastic [Apostasia shenzhenica]